jgi:hypothetical protein
MTPPRLTFLSHFVICLACAAGVFFAWLNEAPQTIWANDRSMMTSVIGALFVLSAIRIGRLAWLADDPAPSVPMREAVGDERRPARVEHSAPVKIDSSYGNLAERLCVMAGFVGTAIGLSLQAQALAGGATSFTALATSLYTTGCGGTAAALIAILTYNLECGIRRAQR